MMRAVKSLATGAALTMMVAGCSQMPSWAGGHAQSASAKKAPQENTAMRAADGGYSMDGFGCKSQATKRLSMYDRPDTYPLSDQERQDAFGALYSECMREHNWQVASPARTAQPTYAANSAAQFANLSPAAGGNVATTANAGNTIVSSTSVPGATVVVIGGTKEANAAQLSSLSPSAGGNGTAPTVVMVQQPQVAYAAPAYYPSYGAAPAPSATMAAQLPVAVPINPSMPAAQNSVIPAYRSPVAPLTANSALPPLAPRPTVAAQATGARPAYQPLAAQQAAPAHAVASNNPAARQQLENIIDQ